MAGSEPSIDNLMGMARTAELAGNSGEAISYFNRVLELDPHYSEAWIGKGKAAAWQSTLAHLRLSEMLVAFNHAIATAPEDQTIAIRHEVTEQVNVIVAALYQSAHNHMLEFVTLESTWGSYLSQVGEMLQALQEAHGWNPTDRQTLENIVYLVKDNIEGVTYRDPIQNSPGWHGITPEYESLLRGRMDMAVAALKEIEPSYAPPAIEKKQAEACFVVTATMGDKNHPTVHLMRQYRDERLRKRKWGRFVIHLYYKIGPNIAAIIQRSILLRAISYQLIVRPAACFARKHLKFYSKANK